MGSLYSSLGGRAAEELIYGNEEITTGCGSDLVSATNIARSMAYQYGMIGDKISFYDLKEIGE